MASYSTAPITLNGFFGHDSDSEEDGKPPGDEDTSVFSQIFEEQLLAIGDLSLKIRQFSWHQANGNQV